MLPFAVLSLNDAFWVENRHARQVSDFQHVLSVACLVYTASPNRKAARTRFARGVAVNYQRRVTETAKRANMAHPQGKVFGLAQLLLAI